MGAGQNNLEAHTHLRGERRCAPISPSIRLYHASEGESGPLHPHGFRPQTSLGFADEMRLGLRGMVRRVWGRRGVKLRQRFQLVYEWQYLFLVVDMFRKAICIGSGSTR